jgi:hypothetical protein
MSKVQAALTAATNAKRVTDLLAIEVWRTVQAHSHGPEARCDHRCFTGPAVRDMLAAQAFGTMAAV